MKPFSILILFSLFFLFRLHSQDTLPYNKILEDTGILLDLLESSHPDPYSSFGGKVFFKLEAQKLINSLPQKGMNLVDFQNYLAAFLSNLHDGHTYIYKPVINKQETDKLFFPLKIIIATDGLIIQDATKEYTDLPGAKILSINGKSIENLLEIIQNLKPCENIFGAYFNLRNTFKSRNDLQLLFPEFNNQLEIEVKTPEGKTLSKKIDFPGSEPEFRRKLNSNSPVKTQKGVFNYQFIDSENKVAYFFLHEMFSQEVIEAIAKWKHPYMPGWGKDVLAKYYGVKDPYDFDKEIKRIPYITTVVKQMLIEMKKNQSSHLIIDLRKNGGGYSFITQSILYLLFGDNFFEKTTKASEIRILSNLYLKKISMTLEEFNKNRNSNYKLGDYILLSDETETDKSVLEKRNEFLDFLKSNEINCFKELEDLKGMEVYQPKTIIILTSPQTFSAAYHFVYDFWEMGKGVKFAGVPSRQAGNTFMENTPFKLPNTGLEGSISNAYQIFFPDDKERGTVFWPDFAMKWEDYKKYNFSEDAEILLVLDLIKSGKL